MAGLDLTKYPATRPAASPKNTAGTSLRELLNRDISLGGHAFSDRKKEMFYLELNILLTAGIDLRTSLDMIEDEQTSDKDRGLIAGVKNSLVAGSSLSEAVRKTGKFTDYEYYSLQIGEESGKLPVILKELAGYFQKKIRQRRQIISAFTYPAIVLSTSLAAVFFMLHFIVPMFAEVFRRFGGDLPFITKAVLGASQVASRYGSLFCLLGAGGFLLLRSQRKQIWFRRLATGLLLRLPLIGEMMRKIYLARFCHAMTLLIGSKIPILRATALIRQMIGFYPIEASLDKVESDIMNGEPLHKALAGFPVYSKRMVSLVKVGEEVNQLDVFFDKIAQQYSEEVEHQTQLIGSMVEPFMIIFLGIIVGFILIAMYLPLFQMSTVF